MNKENTKKRMEEAKEMNAIWENADEKTRAYLKGCIATAAALVGKKKVG